MHMFKKLYFLLLFFSFVLLSRVVLASPIHGEGYGNPSFVVGRGSNALSLPSNPWSNVHFSSALMPSTANYSISYWIYINQHGLSNTPLVFMTSRDTWDAGFMSYYQDSSHTICYNINSDGLCANYTLQTGQWYNIILVSDTISRQMYINGQLVLGKSSSPVPLNLYSTVTLNSFMVNGVDFDINSHSSLIFDDLVFFDYPLSTSQISTISSNTITPFSNLGITNFSHYYPFDENAGDVSIIPCTSCDLSSWSSCSGDPLIRTRSITNCYVGQELSNSCNSSALNLVLSQNCNNTNLNRVWFVSDLGADFTSGQSFTDNILGNSNSQTLLLPLNFTTTDQNFFNNGGLVEVFYTPNYIAPGNSVGTRIFSYSGDQSLDIPGHLSVPLDVASHPTGCIVAELNLYSSGVKTNVSSTQFCYALNTAENVGVIDNSQLPSNICVYKDTSQCSGFLDSTSCYLSNALIYTFCPNQESMSSIYKTKDAIINKFVAPSRMVLSQIQALKNNPTGGDLPAIKFTTNTGLSNNSIPNLEIKILDLNLPAVRTLAEDLYPYETFGITLMFYMYMYNLVRVRVIGS